VPVDSEDDAEEERALGDPGRVLKDLQILFEFLSLLKSQLLTVLAVSERVLFAT
jgi:hypothetical protein